MRALYLTLCIIAVTALPPRQFKRVTEKKLELTTEAKIEPKLPVEETKEPADKKDVQDKQVSRAYYENQSVNVVSTTSTTITDQEKLIPEVNYAPQVSIGGPQVNPAQNEKKHYTPSRLENKTKMNMHNNDDDDKKNVYTVNVYVNFPDDDEHHESEYEDEECRNGKCWAKSKCKEGQISVKGVCTNRTWCIK